MRRALAVKAAILLAIVAGAIELWGQVQPPRRPDQAETKTTQPADSARSRVPAARGASHALPGRGHAQMSSTEAPDATSTCGVSTSSTDGILASTATTATVTVIAPLGCAWTVSIGYPSPAPSNSWIVPATTSGTAQQTVTFSVAANGSPSTRSGYVIVNVNGAAQARHTVVQFGSAVRVFESSVRSTGSSGSPATCTQSSPATPSANAAPAGGLGQVQVTVPDAPPSSAGSCTYYLNQIDSWLRPQGQTTAAYAATPANVTYQADPYQPPAGNSTQRTSYIWLQGQLSGTAAVPVTPDDIYVVVNQAAPAATCAYTLNQNSQSDFPYAGAPATLSVGTGGNSSCNWSVQSSVGWITFLSPSSGSGDNPSFPFTVQPNNLSTSTRAGTISLLNGSTVVASVPVTQDGVQCSYPLSPQSSPFFSAGANSGSFTVQVPASICLWTATPDSNSSWLSITSQAQGTVSYSVSPNTNAAPRTGTIVVSGQAPSTTFTVSQSGGSCAYTLSQTSLSADPGGVPSGSFQVNTSQGCVWSAAAQSNWITLAPQSSSGNGSGTVNFAVAANGTPSPRASSISVTGGLAFTINQPAGVTCNLSLSSTTINAPSAPSSPFPIQVSTPTGCSWNAQPGVSWIGIDKTSGSGAATINLTVAANNSTSSRTGTVSVGSIVLTVSQSAASTSPPAATASFSASPDPVPACNGQQSGTTTFSWNVPGASGVQLRVGSSSGTLLYQGSSSGTFQSSSVTDGEVVVLTDLSGNVLNQVTINLDHFCGATLSQAVMTAQSSWPNGACVVPTPDTSYSNQDATATLWFELQNVSAGSTILVQFIDPYGAPILQQGFNITAAAAQYCNFSVAGVFDDYPNGFVPATLPGGWAAQISLNGTVLGTFPYYISAPLTFAYTLTSDVLVRDISVPPAPSKSFSTSDSGVYTYFATLNSQIGDVNRLYYYRWDATAQTWDSLSETDFQPIPSNSQSGWDWYFEDELPILGNSAVTQNPGYFAVLGTVTQTGGTETSTFQEVFAITPPAPLQVTPSSLSFTALLGGPAPAAQNVSVSSTPSGAALIGTITNGSAWLSASLSGAITPATLTVNVNPAALAVGTYTDSITLTTNSSLTVPVSLTVTNTAPVLSSINPTSAPLFSSAVQLQANGQNFTSDAQVRWTAPSGAQVSLQTQFLSAALLQATLPASYLNSTGTAQVSVVSALGTSNSVPFQITVPTPSISSLSPSSAPAGSPQLTLVVNGTNFISGAQVTWTAPGGSTESLQTQFQNAGLLQATLPASYLTSSGTASVAVSNAGVNSNSVNFQISAANVAPQIATLSPNSLINGLGAVTLLVYGSNFTTSSTVLWNGATVPTTFVSPVELVASVSGALSAHPGNFTISVGNGSLTSNAVNLSIVVPPAASFSSELMTLSVPPADGSCGIPMPANSFPTADAIVYLFFDGTVSNADNLSNDWLGPNGTVIAGATWGNGTGNYCFVGSSLQIGNAPASLLGQWQARVFDNGTLIFSVPFTIRI